MAELFAYLLRNWQAVAIVAVCLAVFTAWQIDRHAQFAAGREAERAAALQKSMELIRERSETNDQINRMDDAALCRELGGRWVQPDNVCE